MNIKKFFRSLGPGIITGAADDDPSGIATYSQAGAQFGYGLLWMALFMLPLQAAIQEACARIGAVTGKGIASVLKENKKQKTLYSVVLLVLIANIINIGADLGAMAAAAQLIMPMNFTVLIFLFTIVILLLEIFISYRVYANILKWLCLTLLTYPLTLFLIVAPWWTILKTTFVPYVEFNFQFLFMVICVLGTTISPYLFFWQASEEVEEEQQKTLLYKFPFKINKKFIKKLQMDNFIGMVLSQVGTWAIIVVTATVLHTHGITNINTAADAAKALEPLVQTFPHSGYIAKVIFSIGVLGLGFLAIPILSASAAYSVGEAVNWQIGLNLKFKQAHGFYGVIIVATLIGLGMNFVGINPIKALIYAALINGIVAVPLIFVIAIIAKDKKIMGKYKSGVLSKALVWLTFISMAFATIILLISSFVTPANS